MEPAEAAEEVVSFERCLNILIDVFRRDWTKPVQIRDEIFKAKGTPAENQVRSTRVSKALKILLDKELIEKKPDECLYRALLIIEPIPLRIGAHAASALRVCREYRAGARKNETLSSPGVALCTCS